MPKFFTLVLLTLFITPGSLLAKEASELTLPGAADVRIIVDISGSMKTNDPGNLRQPAVRLLARMLPEGTEAGVWTFGQYVNMLVPYGEVTDQWREIAIERSGQINSVALRTNLGRAIEVASDDYITGEDLSNTHYILLTDGDIDISDSPEQNHQEELRILDTILPVLAGKGARFHPVALSVEADADFLKELASESGGRFQVANNAEALNRAFLEALNTAVPQQQIPIEGNAFHVDDGVKEFTALIFRNPSVDNSNRTLELVRPDGTVVGYDASPANVRWAQETGYDLITIDEPLSGEWQINGELGEGSRVTVVSDLKMVVSPVPPLFSQSDPINLNVAFFEGEDKITNPDFLQVLNVTLTVTSDDGRSGTKALSGERPPADGVYTDTIENLPIAGKFKIDVVADGQTFARKFSAVTEFTFAEGAAGTSSSGNAPDMTFDPGPKAENAPKVKEEFEPKAETTIESPIDVDLVEQPKAKAGIADEPEPSTDVSSQSAVSSKSVLPLGIMVGAGVGFVAIILLIWFVLRQRKNKEALPDQDESDELVPIVKSEATDANTDEEGLEPVLEVTDEAISDEDEPALDSVIDELVDATDESIPVADVVVEPDELPDDETIPKLDDLADEPVTEKDDGEEDVFGLEDFDLSEFDDLPDDDEPKKK